MGDDLLNESALTGALSLLETGSTQDPELDRTIAATGFTQDAVAKGHSFDEVIASAEALSTPIRKKIEENLITAATDTPLSTEQQLATAILQLAPIFVGAAMSGKRGAMVGAEAGMGGSAIYLKDAEAKNKEKKTLATLQAKQLQGQLGDLSKQKIRAVEGGIKADIDRESREYQRNTSLMAAGIRSKMKEDNINPLATEGIERILARKEPTPEQREAIRNSPNGAKLTIQAQQAADVDGRFQAKRVREQSERKAFSAEIFPGEVISADEGKAGQKLVQVRGEILAPLNELIDSVERYGTEYIGTEAYKQSINNAMLQGSMRELAKTGAALSENEVPYLKLLLSQTPGSEGWTKTFTELLMYGNNPLQNLMNLKNSVDKRVAYGLAANKQFLPNRLDLYDDRFVKEFPKYKDVLRPSASALPSTRTKTLSDGTIANYELDAETQTYKRVK